VNFPRRVLGSVSIACALCAGAALSVPAGAAADAHPSNLCTTPPVSQPFAPWGDASAYTVAPGGDFEGSLDGWALQGADPVSGSETYAATGSLGNYSVSVSAGGTVTSPQTCVDAAYPDFRFFARASDAGATLWVYVLYTGPSGQTVKVPVGSLRPGTSWQPTPSMATGSAIASRVGGGTAQLSLQFKASDGTVQIDDVYIDPWGTCC
jgi:hypothetical protein